MYARKEKKFGISRAENKKLTLSHQSTLFET